MKPTADFLQLNTTTTMPPSMNHQTRPTTATRLTALPKLIPLLLAACLAIAVGCRDDDPSRYPSIEIQGFEPQDYVADLSHSNPEVVFNALSILFPVARDMGARLAGSTDSNLSVDYSTSKAAYQKLFPLLKSRDPRLLAVTLRFLQHFGPASPDRASLAASISRLESQHPLVQFEQVAALTVLATNASQLPPALLPRLLHSPSWMISRATYQLVNKVEDETLRAELLARYAATTEEREKLLILTAFTSTPSPKVIAFLQQELLTSDKQKIREFIAKILASNLDIPGVDTWLATNYQHLSLAARHAVVSLFPSSHTDKGTWIELLTQFLTQGYQPENSFYSALNGLIDDAPDPLPANLQRLDQVVRAHPLIGEKWKSDRAERAQAREHFAALQKEFPTLAQEFTAKAQAMFE